MYLIGHFVVLCIYCKKNHKTLDVFCLFNYTLLYSTHINGGVKSLSQAAACDGTRITTTTIGQQIAPGTLPIY